MTAQTTTQRTAKHRLAVKERMARYEGALAEIARRGALCIHQNIGRWDMTVEHDQRSYSVIESNNRIALEALKPTDPAKNPE